MAMTPDSATQVAAIRAIVRDRVTNFCSHTGPPQEGPVVCPDCERIVDDVTDGLLHLLDRAGEAGQAWEKYGKEFFNSWEKAEARAEQAEAESRRHESQRAASVEYAHGLEGRLEQAQAELARLREIVREFAASGVEFDDERLDHLSIQVSRTLIEEARAT